MRLLTAPIPTWQSFLLFLQDRSGGAAGNSATRTYRVVIPEPSFWDTERPFLYVALVELREGGGWEARVSRHHGLRTFALGPRGLHWNGQSLTLRGVVRDQLMPDEPAA